MDSTHMEIKVKSSDLTEAINYQNSQKTLQTSFIPPSLSSHLPIALHQQLWSCSQRSLVKNWCSQSNKTESDCLLSGSCFVYTGASLRTAC